MTPAIESLVSMRWISLLVEHFTIGAAGSRGGRRLYRLHPAFGGNESNLDAFIEGFGNLLEHGEGAPFVVGIFEATDDGRACSHAFGKLALAETRLRPEVIYSSGNLRVEHFLFVLLDPLRVVSDV